MLARTLIAPTSVMDPAGAGFGSAAWTVVRCSQNLASKARPGKLPPGGRAGTVADIVFGVIWYRTLATHDPLDEQLADELVTALTSADPPRKRTWPNHPRS
jgi:hypothetical protein